MISFRRFNPCKIVTQTSLVLKAYLPSSNKFTTSSLLKNSKKNICIVGSGPAALYSAQYLIKNLTDIDKSIDIYEKLPVPFGLVIKLNYLN